MKTRPSATVAYHYAADRRGNHTRGAQIRLRGKWVSQVFQIGTKLQITREMRNGKVVLVIEPMQ
jgi:hypothetical protein